MLRLTLFLILSGVLANGAVVPEAQIERQETTRRFPDGFIFGTATSSYQIEGAWNVDGKGDSMWDYFTNLENSPIIDNSTGNDATKSYYLYKRDVEMLRELGVDHYRFSIAWPRILPRGFSNEINQLGVDYYNNLIDELLAYNITPIITLYHWELPYRFHQLGGWANPAVVDWFGDFSRVAFSLFGDRVKLWVTINEPTQICYFGYGWLFLAPFIDFKAYGEYMCAKNVLLAHARSYHIYDEEFRASQGGQIFISLSAGWHEGESEEHELAAIEVREFDLGQYAYPIFSESGDWPSMFKQKIAAKSSQQGFSRSRLPDLTPEEVEYIRGTSDLFGLNHYSTYIVYRNESVYSVSEVPSRIDDMDALEYQRPEWFLNDAMVRYAPFGLHKLLNHIRVQYGNPTVYITENGFSYRTTGLNDDLRVQYYRGYLDAMLDAIDDGCDVRAYTAWSLMDNFEWSQGYTQRFGLYEVDFEDENRTRTPRKSALVYKEILRTRTLDWSFEPDMTTPGQIQDQESGQESEESIIPDVDNPTPNPALPDSATSIATHSIVLINVLSLILGYVIKS